MVFQNYALYPHMTVRQNMASAWKQRKIAKDEITAPGQRGGRARSASTEHLDRKPARLSGASASGWRWAGRSCATRKAFLMDEPLSNLDAKLRVADARRSLRSCTTGLSDDRLRHPRPDRGDDPRRPGSRDARRRAAAG